MSLDWRHPAALSKVRMLEASLRCFTLGLLGLIPVLGLPAALLAMLEFRSVVLFKTNLWNPARPYLIGGAWLGGIGLIVTLLALGGIVVVLIQLLGQ